MSVYFPSSQQRLLSVPSRAMPHASLQARPSGVQSPPVIEQNKYSSVARGRLGKGRCCWWYPYQIFRFPRKRNQSWYLFVIHAYYPPNDYCFLHNVWMNLPYSPASRAGLSVGIAWLAPFPVPISWSRCYFILDAVFLSVLCWPRWASFKRLPLYSRIAILMA